MRQKVRVPILNITYQEQVQYVKSFSEMEHQFRCFSHHLDKIDMHELLLCLITQLTLIRTSGTSYYQ